MTAVLAERVARDLADIVGAKALIVPPDTAEFDRGYRYGAGQSLCVVRPRTVEEIRSLVRYCVGEGIRLLTQGANTGLVGASSPDSSGEQIVLSLDRMSGLEDLDPLDRTATVLSGTRLSVVNAAAAPYNLVFPIDLGADPSIGGMVATNTGGARLLRFGDVQRNLLGLEVVLVDEQATLLTDLRGLRKDNSGVDWKQLFVGTGGAYGIITRARIELHRQPQQTLAALLVPRDHAVVPAIVDRLEATLGEALSACEGMSRNALFAAFKHHPSLRNPFDEIPDYALLIELGTSFPAEAGIDLEALLAFALGPCFEGDSPILRDTLIGRGEEFWAIRHAISDGLKRSGAVIAFDVAMPRSRLPQFRDVANKVVASAYPFLQVCDFGHCGDGGDHFNIVWPADLPRTGSEYAGVVEALQELIYDLVVHEFGGTFSAEHGVGPHNLRFYQRYTSPGERALAGRLKSIFDPKGLVGNVDFH
jgi:FAD/FMN-containing dehydrogenase